MPYTLNANLTPGQRGHEVSQLQQFLVEQGFLTPEQVATGPGVYGPRTTAAVKKWQQSQGASKPQTQESVDKLYKDEAAKNPAISSLVKGGSSLEEVVNALTTGDISGIRDSNGQPFSVKDQQEALSKGMEDNKLYYEAMQAKDTADTEAALAKKQADYQDYLITSGQNFEADKTKLDQEAANRGVLFSGARAQKERVLGQTYSQDQATKLRNVGSEIGNTSRDFQYKYGDDASKGLNQYYNLGGNTFNPNVSTGGVGQSGLSSVYNPSGFNFQGTANTERSSNAKTRAAGYLWNKGNKLLATGYTNKY